MTLILLLIAAMLIVQLALWLAITRFRHLPDDTEATLPASVARREAAWWLIATIIVLILLGLLAHRVISRADNARRSDVGDTGY